MIHGIEVQDIIQNIFTEVRGYRKSEQIKVCCPKCQERDGLLYSDGKFNLEINTKKNVFKCWKCDDPKYSGSIGKLIRNHGTTYDYKLYKSYSRLYYNNPTFYITSDLNENDEDEEYYNVNLPAEFIPFNELNNNLKSHMDFYNYWVLDRKFDISFLEKYNIGFCTEGDYKDRIIIPSYDKFGELNYFIGRYIGNNKKEPKYKNIDIKKTKIVFNENKIDWDSTVYLVEGAFDMFSLPSNTIVLLGKELYPLIYNQIKEHKPNLVIVLDPDAIKESINIYRELLTIYGYHNNNNKIKLVELKGDDDIDEIRKNRGHNAVVELLKNAVELNLNSLDVFDK